MLHHISHRQSGPDGLCVFILGRPEDAFFRTEVVPHLPYMHLRSGKFLDIICCGYDFHSDRRRTVEVPLPNEVQASDGGLYRSIHFSQDGFISIVRKIEDDLANQGIPYRYSGHTDALFLSVSQRDNPDNHYHPLVEFVGCTAIDIERMTKSGALRSARDLIERLLEHQERNPNTFVANEFVREQMKRNAMSGVLGYLLTILGVPADRLAALGDWIKCDRVAQAATQRLSNR